MKSRKLRDILCENTQIRRLQPDVMNKVNVIVNGSIKDGANDDDDGDDDGDDDDDDVDDDKRWTHGTA